MAYVPDYNFADLSVYQGQQQLNETKRAQQMLESFRLRELNEQIRQFDKGFGLDERRLTNIDEPNAEAYRDNVRANTADVLQGTIFEKDLHPYRVGAAGLANTLTQGEIDLLPLRKLAMQTGIDVDRDALRRAAGVSGSYDALIDLDSEIESLQRQLSTIPPGESTRYEPVSQRLDRLTDEKRVYLSRLPQLDIDRYRLHRGLKAAMGVGDRAAQSVDADFTIRGGGVPAPPSPILQLLGRGLQMGTGTAGSFR